MSSIARKNLFEDIPRFLVAQAGIMFAVSLVTIQTGILEGFSRSTVRVIDESTADLWVSHKSMEYLDLTSPLSINELVQVQKVPGVEQAEAISIQGTRWRSPNGRIDNVRIYGFDPDGELFANWKLTQGEITALNQPYTIFVDQANRSMLGLDKAGAEGEVASLPARLIGLTRDTQSMASSPFVFTSLRTANAYMFSGLTAEVKCTRQASGDLRCVNVFEKAPESEQQATQPPKPLTAASPITYVLVKAASGQDIQALRKTLEATVPDSRVLTKAEMADLTRTYWRERTGVGFILGLGAVVGVVVGMVVVSQILYSSVTDHLKEFGTLKAMGASDWVVYRVITEQALWMAVLGYIPSMLLCVGLGSWTMAAKGIMILITPATAVGVFGITVIMCIGSAVFAIQKVTHVDPAIVFKA